MSNLPIRQILILGIIILISSCKKENDSIEFQFEITTEDFYNASPIQGTIVRTSTKGVNSGTYNNTFQLQSSETTDINGIANLSAPYGSIEVIKMEIEKEGYFSQSLEYNPDDFSTENINHITFPMKQKGFINIGVTNAFPLSAYDEIIFNSINADCQECVNFNSITLNGTAVDTTLQGTIVQNRYYKYQYIITKGGVANTVIDSTYCTNDTTFIQINY